MTTHAILSGEVMAASRLPSVGRVRCWKGARKVGACIDSMIAGSIGHQSVEVWKALALFPLPTAEAAVRRASPWRRPNACATRQPSAAGADAAATSATMSDPELDEQKRAIL
eukprot:365578-Chlamydomonas_euryale.AAC.5